MPALEPAHGGAVAIIAYRMGLGDNETDAREAARAYVWPEETALPSDFVAILDQLNT